MKEVRVFSVLLALVFLAGCNSQHITDVFLKRGDQQQAEAAAKAADPANETQQADPEPTGTVAAVVGPGETSNVGMLGADPKDDLSLGKQHFRQENYGLAEHYFRRAAEAHPRDAEAWLGLAASYDRLRRFELADRAYKQAIVIAGATPEVLNNQGYSYLLRGDYARARAKFAEARTLDPGNPYILNNIKLLEDTARKGKSVQR